MGREWLFKAGGGGVDGSGGGGGKRPATTTNTKSVSRKTKRERNSSSSGCMSAIFNYFGVQQYHQFRFHHPSLISESAINNHIDLQGVEAPRNSLEYSPESAMDVDPSLSSKLKEKTNYNIQMDGIQIKTKRSRLTEDLSSESSSPGTKTPNLVARLMGLDLLPEYSSPRPSSSSTPVNSHHHSRSLPATPRISTASRASTDNDYKYNHRLSLQIDKENRNRYKGQEHDSLQKKMARRRSELLVHREDDENTSEYAKQIANQVRERINRRLGTDITNTMSRNKEQRRDSNLVLLKPKKPSPLKTPAPAMKSKQDESAPVAISPKLRLLDIKSNLNKPISNLQLSSSFKEVASNSKPETPLKKQSKPVKDEKIQRIVSERYELRLKKMHHQEKICKKSTSLRNHVVNSKNTTKFPSFKKAMTSSSSATRLSQKQLSLMNMTHLHSSLNSSYNANDVRMIKFSDQDFNNATGATSSDHFDYISRILHHCGINTTTPISAGQWYSTSHPLHPSIFHKLEKLYHPTTTVKRRMIFELVDELLSEFLKTYTNLKPWVCPRTLDSCSMRGSDLIGKLCEKVGSIRAIDCEVLEDVDGLIERDIGRSIRRLGSTAFEEEAENIVKEIESEIVETLMHEISTVTVTVAPAGSDRMTSHVSFT